MADQGVRNAPNDKLYDASGLRAAHAALRPGGVLAVWSAEPSEGFSSKLRKNGFSVDEIAARARGKRGGARHTIWLATKVG